MIDHLDHIAFTAAHREACIGCCTRLLGMQLETFVGGTPTVERLALQDR